MQTINAQDGIQAATAVFHSLVSNRVADRYKATEYLESPSCLVDYPTLRTLLTKGITQDYYAGKEDEQDDEEMDCSLEASLFGKPHQSHPHLYRQGFNDNCDSRKDECRDESALDISEI